MGQLAAVEFAVEQVGGGSGDAGFEFDAEEDLPVGRDAAGGAHVGGEVFGEVGFGEGGDGAGAGEGGVAREGDKFKAGGGSGGMGDKDMAFAVLGEKAGGVAVRITIGFARLRAEDAEAVGRFDNFQQHGHAFHAFPEEAGRAEEDDVGVGDLLPKNLVAADEGEVRLAGAETLAEEEGGVHLTGGGIVVNRLRAEVAGEFGEGLKGGGFLKFGPGVDAGVPKEDLGFKLTK